MAEKQWEPKYPHDAGKYGKYKPSHDFESASEPHVHHKHLDESSPHGHPKFGYIPYGVSKSVKKVKTVYDPGYVAHAPKPSSHKCPPIVCDPQYVVRDCYIPREVPVVHPIVNVNRHVIVNVPKHYYQPMTKNVVVDPGCPGCHKPGHY
jgi:hypothetical protein